MKTFFKRYRYSVILLKQLVKTDFKLRYQGSVLGYLWTLLRPLALFAILYLVFAVLIGVGDGLLHWPIQLLLGVVLWNYFVEVTTGAVGSIVGNGDLIRKINFPKYVIVLAGSLSALINLSINFLVIAFFMYLSNVEVSLTILLLPFIIAQLFICSLAIAFLLSALYVRLRDLNYIWEVIIQASFYLTPILIPISTIVEKSNTSVAKLLMLNPMAQIIQDARYVAITKDALTIDVIYGNHFIRAVPYGLTLLTATVAFIYFRKRSRYFAEEV